MTRKGRQRIGPLDRCRFPGYPQSLMPQTDAQPRPKRGLLGPRNLIVLGAAVACLVVGYVTLSAGHPSLAAVLLVLGYCVLFPLAIAL